MKRTNSATWMEKYNRWQINVQKDGKRRTFTSSKPGRVGQREANAKADAWLDDGIDSAGQTVAALWDQYVESLKLTTSRAHWSKYVSTGRTWVQPHIGAKRLDKLSVGALQSIIDKAASKGLARKTLSNIRAEIMSFCRWCRLNNLTVLNPEFLSVPKSAPPSHKTILQPDDILDLFTYTQTLWHGRWREDDLLYAYRLQVLTGLRPGELMGLQWIDLDHGVLHVRRSINRFREVTRGKNDNAVRDIVLPISTLNVLQDQYETCPPDCGDDQIFTNLSLRTYEDRWARFCEVNQIKRVMLYELRHTFVSVISEMPEASVKAIAGHSRNMDTFGVYGHEVRGQRQKDAIRIDEIFQSILDKGGVIKRSVF